MRPRHTFWLVLLLVCILPIKAAIAAGGLACHVAGAQTSMTHARHAPSADHTGHGVAGDAMHAHHADATTDAPASDDVRPPSAATCLACAAVCGAPALPASAAPALPAHVTLHAWHGLSVSMPPGHIPAGLERPPRRT